MVLVTPWGGLNFTVVLLILLGFATLILLGIQPLLRRRFA
jgi:hypothetical protein